jgi:LmbE family N-acetylglucosaminyl deacetylase
VLAVFAHPDDESFACGGTLARLAEMGCAVVLVCASRGERGAVAEPLQTSTVDLGEIRVRELRAAGRVLGIRTIHALTYPDGNLRWVREELLREDIARVIRAHRPDAVITFDDDGLYWHPDHLAVHEQTSKAVLTFGAEAPSLYYVTMPRGLMPFAARRASEKRWQRPSAGVWSIDPSAFGVAAKAPTFAVDIRPWVIRKLEALQCHRTQVGAVNPFSLLDAPEALEWLGFEYFRRAPIVGQRRVVLEHMAGRIDVGTAS